MQSSQLIVDNSVEKCVENSGIKWELLAEVSEAKDIHRVIYGFFERFPLIFDGKRYKLINFAPKTESVDNYRSVRNVSKLQSTMSVETTHSRGDKLSDKKKAKKFCTYQRCIILLILFFKKRKEKRIIIIWR